MKTASQIDGYVSFTAGPFAQCPALNEPPAMRRVPTLKKVHLPQHTAVHWILGHVHI